MKLKDKVAIVTGGARGSGAAIVRAFADEGAHVVIVDVDTAEAATVAAEFGGNAMAVRLDVRDAAIGVMMGAVLEMLGGVASWSTTPACSTWGRSRNWRKPISTVSSASM